MILDIQKILDKIERLYLKPKITRNLTDSTKGKDYYLQFNQHIMLSSLSIKGFRGIKEGFLEEFSQINVFVGRNNSGKSTILDALYLLSSLSSARDPLMKDIIKHTASRRSQREYLEGLYYGYEEKPMEFDVSLNSNIEIKAKFEGNWTLSCHLLEPFNLWVDSYLRGTNSYELRKGGGLVERYDDIHRLTTKMKKLKGEAGDRFIDAIHSFKGTIIFDSSLLSRPEDLEKRVWPKLTPQREDKKLTKLINDIYETDIENFSYLPIKDRNELMAMFKENSIRVDDLGDGFRYAFMILATIFAFKPPIALIEEPENHQRPTAFNRFTKTLTDFASRYKSQFFISTHSHEFLKGLIDAVRRTNVGFNIYPLILKEGNLETRRIKKIDADVLEDLGVDLRTLEQYA